MMAALAFRDAVQASLGHAPDLIEPGRLYRFATSNRRGDSAGWCKLFEDGRAGVFGDWRMGINETWTATSRAAMTQQERTCLARQVMAAAVEREAELRRLRVANAKRIDAVWAQCVPLEPGDPVALYLDRRGISTWPLPECLRLHRALAYWHEGEKLGEFPAMVAPLVSPDGRIVALHRTYLAADGHKAKVPTVKKLTATAGPLAGACIALHEAARGVIGIAEGIETALAARLASGIPTVAAGNAGNLAAWQWPRKMQRLVVFGDNDRAGRDATDQLRVRAKVAGLRCDVMTPTTLGDDWADVWAARWSITLEGATA